MAVTRKKKESELAEVEALLDGAKAVVFADYRGTTVKKIDELRRSLSRENVSTKVAKITLIRLALKARGIDAGSLDPKVPVAMVVSKDDEVAPARILAEFAKANKNVRLLMGIMENRFITAAEVSSLATMPSKHELYGMLVGTMAAPVSGFVNVLAGNLRSLVYVLSAVAESKQ